MMKQYSVTFITKKGGEEDHEILTMARNAKEAIVIAKEIWYEHEGNTMHAFLMKATEVPEVPEIPETTSAETAETPDTTETTETPDTTTEDTPKQSDDCKDVVKCYVSECPEFSCCKKALLSAPEKHSDVYDWHDIKFIDREHRQLFERLVSECRVLHDPYRLALFYLIALDSDCRRHIRDIYDFRERCVNSEVLEYSWVTDTSRRTLELAFSLFNGFYFKADVSDVFSCYYEYMEYYFDAVRLRFQRW